MHLTCTGWTAAPLSKALGAHLCKIVSFRFLPTYAVARTPLTSNYCQLHNGAIYHVFHSELKYQQ